MGIRSLAIVATGALAGVLAGISHWSVKSSDPDIGLFQNDRAALAYLQTSRDFGPDTSGA